MKLEHMRVFLEHQIYFGIGKGFPLGFGWKAHSVKLLDRIK